MIKKALILPVFLIISALSFTQTARASVVYTQSDSSLTATVTSHGLTNTTTEYGLQPSIPSSSGTLGLVEVKVDVSSGITSCSLAVGEYTSPSPTGGVWTSSTYTQPFFTQTGSQVLSHDFTAEALPLDTGKYLVLFVNCTPYPNDAKPIGSASTDPNTGSSFVANGYNLTSLYYVVRNDSGSGPTPSQIYSFSYATSTGIATVSGFWNASTTSGISEKLTFWQQSSQLGQEGYDQITATSTGNFTLHFAFPGLPTPYAGSHIQRLI